jgi:hypothetical protein
MVPVLRFTSVVCALLFVILTAVLLPTSASAQFDAATVLGTVRDSSGAVDPGARLVILWLLRRSCVR